MSERAELASTPLANSERKTPTRARVWRACEVCRKRKVKCNGQEPCAYCLSSGKICSFKDINDNAAVARQQSNTVDIRLAKIEETLRTMQPMAQAFAAWLRANPQYQSSALPFEPPDSAQSSAPSPEPSGSQSVSPSQYRASAAIKTLSHSGFSHQAEGSLNLTQEIVQAPPSDAPEGWSERSSYLTKDSYGSLRYTGGASSYMLVDALTSVQDSQPTTDTSPGSTRSNQTEIRLPFFNPNKHFKTHHALPRPEDIVYPPPEQADELVATYFSRIHHTFPVLHQQSFVERYMKVMEEKSLGKASQDHAFLCLLFAVFACGACLSTLDKPKSREKSPEGQTDFGGWEFYERALLFLWLGMGSSKLEHVQCLAILAICNATWNTLAQSWINAGGAVRRAQDLGLHRSGRRLPLTPFDREIRRRVWWCVYGLDRVLSMTLGRPSGTHDDDCDIDMPAELDDAQLTALRDGNAVAPQEKSFMTGFVALLGIYVIAGRIMRFVQSKHIDDPRSEAARKTRAALDADLAHWINNLPPYIRFSANDTSNPKLLSLCLIAFFVYYSAIINLHRPFIPDQSYTPSDLTSLIQCISAARSCIRIGEITQEMLPASHHLAFAVQYITLSAILLLRSIAYVNHPDLLSSIFSDAERCILILKGTETISPASKRCREIVTDLLVVVRTKQYGGSSAIEALQAAQQPRGGNGGSSLSDTSLTPSKRKSSSNENLPPPSRRRLDDESPSNWEPVSVNDNFMGRHYSDSILPSHDQLGHFTGATVGGGQYHQRLSDLRTSVENDGGSPTTSSHHFMMAHRPHSNMLQHNSDTLLREKTQLHVAGANAHENFQKEPVSSGLPPPQITSLDLNSLSAIGIDGACGYEFLEDELSTVLGNIVRPSSTPISAQTFEENAQVLWQAYQGPMELFGGD
ncbi:hypothetical protein K435DRAFT_961147 [Dendrothele bispora CBS 962.96]|uniref:Zn(2)-C6 fungal-type domain-containing protein n=1 Tax=Dendrothele bispora (strain CBS 962.96) TaxID=1314807 RepID=A0A4S8MR34_DENBC|nr:hypothetical protein K435DRAFT_961147 [Dendrothele bispora CBS 962.96]